MAYCSRCGNPLKKETNYCPRCGHPVSGKVLKKNTFSREKVIVAVAIGLIAIVGLCFFFFHGHSSKKQSTHYRSNSSSYNTTTDSENSYSDVVDSIVDESLFDIEENKDYKPSSDQNNLDWLQGHWVYEQGNYKGHFIIQGNTITQYSSMNPEHVEKSFRVEGNEIRARLIDGMDLTAKIDFANQRIDYGDGQWMHKISSESSSQKVASSEERLFRNEDDVYMNFVSQTFVDNSGLKIRFGGNGEMEIDGDYAGIAQVKTFTSQRALLKYSGGVYGEGFIILSIEGGTARLIDPNDPSSVWYRKRFF